jgi:hypothetical protein
VRSNNDGFKSIPPQEELTDFRWILTDGENPIKPKSDAFRSGRKIVPSLGKRLSLALREDNLRRSKKELTTEMAYVNKGQIFGKGG